MSLLMMSNNAAFLALHIKGEISDLNTFKKQCKFILTELYLNTSAFENLKNEVKDWSMEECKYRLKELLDELELTEFDLIQ